METSSAHFSSVNCSYMSFYKLFTFLAIPSKRLMIHATIRFIALIDSQLEQGNVHGCGCIYSDWCFNSEVQFNYFFIYVFIVIFYSFRLGVRNLIFFGDPNVLCNIWKLLLHLLGIFTNI